MKKYLCLIMILLLCCLCSCQLSANNRFNDDEIKEIDLFYSFLDETEKIEIIKFGSIETTINKDDFDFKLFTTELKKPNLFVKNDNKETNSEYVLKIVNEANYYILSTDSFIKFDNFNEFKIDNLVCDEEVFQEIIENNLKFDFSFFLKDAETIEFDLYEKENVVFNKADLKFKEIINRIEALELKKSAPINGTEYNKIIITCSNNTILEFDGFRLIVYTVKNGNKIISYKHDFFHNVEDYRTIINDFTV